jgi:hypothetical protein
MVENVTDGKFANVVCKEWMMLKGEAFVHLA